MGRERQLRLHSGLLSLYAQTLAPSMLAIRSADASEHPEKRIDKGMGGQRARLGAWW
jgi:hypothetical protein